MTNFTFNILVFLAVFVYADALQCIVGNKYNCTTHNVTYTSQCEQLEARNQAFAVQTCSAGQDKCLLFASEVSFQDKFDLQLITTTCGTGTLDGCNNRQELLAINPGFGQINEFSAPGYEYDSLEICVCDTDVCVDEDDLSEYGMAIFGYDITADQLQCISGNEYNCTAHDVTYIGFCEKLEARNRAFAEQTCSIGQDKCLLFASKLSFEDKFDLQLIITACGTGTLDGCNNRQELLAVNPSFGQIDEFSGPGYEYGSLDICVCNTDLCIDEDTLSVFQKIIFSNDASCLHGHFIALYVLMLGTFLVN